MMDHILPFMTAASRQILSGQKDSCLCSPLNLYLTLSMTAEISGGSTRGQVLDLPPGAPDLLSLRERARLLWTQGSAEEPGEVSLASSLWLSSAASYRQETIDVLRREHFAESFIGTPGTAEFDRLLQSWTNERTGGLLSAGALRIAPDSLLTLMGTVYFKVSWNSPFPEEQSAPGTFHGPGGDSGCVFMERTQACESYYRGEGFGAAALPFVGGESMTFILPDEGIGIAELLSAGSELWEFLEWRVMNIAAYSEHPTWRGEELAKIRYVVPRFDVSSDNELSGDLKALGVSEAFDGYASDFTPLTVSGMPMRLSEVKHAARVKIDEKGCTAASFVEMGFMRCSAMFPEMEVDFILNRPFIFMVQTRTGAPLFIGAVERPGPR